MTQTSPLAAVDHDSLRQPPIPVLQPDFGFLQQELNTALAQLLEQRVEAESQRSAAQSRVRHLEEMLASRDQEITDRESQISSLLRAVADRDRRIDAIREQAGMQQQTLADRDARIATLNQALAEGGARIAWLDNSLAECNARLRALHASTSWRVTAPLRWLKVGSRPLLAILRDWIYAVYLASPIPSSLKVRIKRLLLALLGAGNTAT